MTVNNDGLSKISRVPYHLKDHLGNVRLTFSASPDIATGTATLEKAHGEEEHATFLHSAETTKINSTLFDHTASGDTHYAVRLNGSENERIGLARSLDPDQNNWTAALHDLMAAIAAGTAPPGTVIEAVPGSGGDGFPFGGLLGAAKAGETGTQVYDENLDTLDMAYAPVTDAAKENGSNSAHERLALEFVVQQPGYVYIYFSNDNGQPLEVFFDDFTVEHVHLAIVQADDYYPFGLTFDDPSQQVAQPKNLYLYNGKEFQEETDWYDYGARMYQPEICRFFTQDRFAEKYFSMSPYQYAANNPILYIDVNGDSVWVTSQSNIDKNGNVTVNHTVHITGKVLKQGTGSTKASDLANGLNERLNAQSSSTSTINSGGKINTVNTSIKASFTAASSMDDVASVMSIINFRV